MLSCKLVVWLFWFYILFDFIISLRNAANSSLVFVSLGSFVSYCLLASLFNLKFCFLRANAAAKSTSCSSDTTT